MKRLCVFYRLASQWQGKRVEWIVCKECQKKIQNGRLINLLFQAAARGKVRDFYDG
jgi:hypothetical protein